MNRIGFPGLGNMGLPMSVPGRHAAAIYQRFADAGYEGEDFSAIIRRIRVGSREAR